MKNSTAHHSGIVRWFNAKLGYGFIAIAPSLKLELGMPADADLYVHTSGIIGRTNKVLAPEDRVEFLVQSGRQGPRAVAVQITGQVAHEPLSTLRD